MLLDKMVKAGVELPSFLPSNTLVLTYMGSRAYNAHSADSDYDTYGVCFPTLNNLVGFTEDPFQQWHPENAIELNGKEYDITVYSLVKFFKLAAQNNPNILDFLFVPRNCIIHNTDAWENIREHRKMFLHKGSWHRFKNYAYSQLTQLNHRKYVHSKRIELVEKYGFDTKFASHVIRLCLECEQILTEQDLDLTRNSDIIKSVRNGEWTLEKINKWFDEKESQLEKFYEQSMLPAKPDYNGLSRLLMDTLNKHYEGIPKVDNTNLLEDLKQLVNKHS